MAKVTRYKDLLDYTVSYKMVWLLIGVVFAFGVAAAIAWTQLKPPSELEKARQEVKSAERLVTRAEGCGQSQAAVVEQKLFAGAIAALASARQSLESKAFGEASASARDAQTDLKSYIDRVCVSGATVAEFSRIQGDVKVKKVQSPRWVQARKGPLAVGDRIWALSGAAVIFYPASGETQDLRPGTIIEIKNVVRRDDGSSGTETVLESGEFSMKSAPGSPSTVTTPHATVEPAGDRVEIEAREGKDTRVTSYLGGARVKRGDKVAQLDRHTRVSANSTGLGEVLPSLPPPEPKEPIQGRVFSADKPEDKVVIFKWFPVTAAQGYSFEVARNDVFVPLLNEGDERVAGTTVDIVSMPANQYYWRVAAVDKLGVRGDWSEVRAFSIRGGMPAGKGPPPPKIQILDKIELGDRVIISGKTAQYVALEALLNGHKYSDVPLDDSGGFQVLVTLSQEGKNIIEIVAHDTYGQETKEAISAYFSPL